MLYKTGIAETISSCDGKKGNVLILTTKDKNGDRNKRG
jgi:hypothetical protein